MTERDDGGPTEAAVLAECDRLRAELAQWRGERDEYIGYRETWKAAAERWEEKANDALAQVAAMREATGHQERMFTGFEGEIERVERHRLARTRGGQHVPCHGDFVGANATVLGRMRWWLREFRAALAETTKPGEGGG